MSEQGKACTVENGILKMCKALDKVLLPEANARGKGAYLLVISDLSTGEVARIGAVIRSGKYAKKGALFNYCPFCGENISHHFRKGGEGATTTQCPDRRMTEEERGLVYQGKLDFKDGKWVRIIGHQGRSLYGCRSSSGGRDSDMAGSCGIPRADRKG